MATPSNHLIWLAYFEVLVINKRWYLLEFALRMIIFKLGKKIFSDIIISEFRDSSIDIWWYEDVTTSWRHTLRGLGFWLQTILKVLEVTNLWFLDMSLVVTHSYSTSRLPSVRYMCFYLTFFNFRFYDWFF